MTYSKIPTETYCFFLTHPNGATVSYFTPSGFKTWGGTGYHKEEDARSMAKRHPHLTLCRVEED